MAIKTPLKPALKRIADVIADYVQKQGLQRSDVALLGSWNEQTGRISILLATTHQLMLTGMRRWYAEILDDLRDRFSEAGDLPTTWNIGLVIKWTVDMERVFSSFTTPDDEEDITDILQSGLDAGWPRSD